MSLDVRFKGAIRNTLIALHGAVCAALPRGVGLQGAALHAVALVFGIASNAQVVSALRFSQADGLHAVCDAHRPPARSTTLLPTASSVAAE